MSLNAKVNMFGISIDKLDMVSSVQLIAQWLDESARVCKYVVTPNVDHVVKLSSNAEFKVAYQNASMVVADGKPIIASSKLLGDPLPETVPGSDLVPSIFEYFHHQKLPLKVFLLGAMPGVAAKAAEKIEARWTSVKVVGVHSPDFGFEKDKEACLAICKMIAESGADLLVLGLGAPKQELWVHKYSQYLPVKVALCVGATIDFLAGEKARAPIWMRKVGIEWLHRMLTEPRRLVKRYFLDAILFPRIFFLEWQSRRK